MNRFFRTSAEVYTKTREALDRAFEHPNSRADTCLPPVEEAPKDTKGQVYLAVLDQMFKWPVVQDNVDNLIKAGLVEEIDEKQYREIFPPSDLKYTVPKKR